MLFNVLTSVFLLIYRWKRPTFHKDGIRLIVYRNNERTVLFDTKSVIVKVHQSEKFILWIE